MTQLSVDGGNIGLVEEREDYEREAPKNTTNADFEDISLLPVSWNILGDYEVLDEDEDRNIADTHKAKHRSEAKTRHILEKRKREDDAIGSHSGPECLTIREARYSIRC